MSSQNSAGGGRGLLAGCSWRAQRTRVHERRIRSASRKRDENQSWRVLHSLLKTVSASNRGKDASWQAVSGSRYP